MTAERIAGWFTIVLVAYVAAGLMFAVAFVLRGVQRVDPDAREGTWGFRLVIFPGSVALWPLLLSRWVRFAVTM